MAHKKHPRGMKHYSGTGKSKTLKERIKQYKREMKMQGYTFWKGVKV